MFGLLLLAFLLVPVVEIVLFSRVAADIGLGSTLLLIVAISVAGAWLVKREGMTAWRRANERLADGEVPTDELVNGLLILMAGALMLTPGFLTDAVGLLALFPPTRAIARRSLRTRFSAKPAQFGFGSVSFGHGAGRSPESTPEPGVWDVEGWEDPPDRPGID